MGLIELAMHYAEPYHLIPLAIAVVIGFFVLRRMANRAEAARAAAKARKPEVTL